MRTIDKHIKAFGENLIKLREEKSLSYRDIEAEIGISRASIHQYENFLNDPRMTSIIAISEFFDVNIEWLIGISDIRGKYREV